MPEIPEHLRDIESWETSRRSFVKAALISGLAIQLPALSSCENDTYIGNAKINAIEVERLNVVLQQLWPNDNNGPGIEDLKSLDYIVNLLLQEEKHQEHNKFIVEGIKWANDVSGEKKNANLENLSLEELDDLMLHLTTDDYGERWCSVLITYIFESLILDPIYGAQPNEIGWTWLDHTPGRPRPTENNHYDEILKIVNDEV